MKNIFLAIISLLFVISLNGQTTFEKYYDIYDYAYSNIVFTQDDGYLMAMISRKDKIYLSFIKTDLNGDTLWTKDYDMGFEYLTSVGGADDEEGNLYISIRYGNENLLKLDENANIIWAKEYTYLNLGMAVKENTLWICGNPDQGNYLYKIDAATGDSLWRSDLFNTDPIYGTSSYATSTVVLENGDVVVTASLSDSYDGTQLKSEFYRLPANTTQIIKFTLPTDELFVVTDSKNIGNEIISIANGLLYSSEFKTCFFIKYTSDGTMLAFTKDVFGYSSARLYECVITNDNQVVAVGTARTEVVPRDVLLHCFSMNGDSLWTRLLNRPEAQCYDIKMANDNGFIVTGGYGLGNNWKPYLLKTNSLGTLNAIPERSDSHQQQVYPNPASDHIIVHSSGQNIPKTVKIYGIDGTLKLAKALVDLKTKIDISRLSPGIYLVVSDSPDGINQSRLVVL